MYWKKDNRGFTLIELLIVISIIGILAAIGIVIYQNASKQGRDAKEKADILEIQKALENYYLTAGNKSYPNALTSLNSTRFFPSGAVPKDSSGVDYSGYSKCPNANTQRYRLCTQLEVTNNGNSSSNIDPCTGNPSAPGSGNYFCVVSQVSN